MSISKFSFFPPGLTKHLEEAIMANLGNYTSQIIRNQVIILSKKPRKEMIFFPLFWMSYRSFFPRHSLHRRVSVGGQTRTDASLVSFVVRLQFYQRRRGTTRLFCTTLDKQQFSVPTPLPASTRVCTIQDEDRCFLCFICSQVIILPKKQRNIFHYIG